MKNVMLDLETMGNGSQSAIIAIGACTFGIAEKVIGTRFYATVDLASSVAAGGAIDAATVLWWMRQGDAARSALSANSIGIALALSQFAAWMHEQAPRDDVCVWGNGSDFDNTILASAYARSEMQQPWRYWNNRCYRTVKSLYPSIVLQRVGTHHNAVDDAESQARHLIAMLASGAPVCVHADQGIPA